MRNTILEAIGLLAGVAALTCFVIAAWSVSTVLGVSVLGAAFTVVAVVLVIAAHPRRATP